MNLKEYKKKALQKPSFKAEYERYDLRLEIGLIVMKARILKGLTQSKLASLIGTKQPSIARLESGSSLPSLSFLEKIAKAFGTHLIAPEFADLNISVRSDDVFKSQIVHSSSTPFTAVTYTPIPLEPASFGYPTPRVSIHSQSSKDQYFNLATV